MLLAAKTPVGNFSGADLAEMCPRRRNMKSPVMVFALMVACLTYLVAGEKEFQIVGKVLQENGRPFVGVVPVVFLHGAITPFAAQTQSEPDGGFRFKNLAAGTYNLTVAVPRVGEMRRTVEVGASFADARGRITVTLTLERSKPETASDVVSTAELAIPDSALVEYKKAQDALSRRDIEKAVAHLKKAVAIAPQYAAALNSLGTIAYQARKFQEAEAYFRESLKQNPETYSALVNLGGAVAAQGKIEESLTVNLEAVRIRPDDALAQSQLGSSYFFLGRLDEAENRFRRAKALDPSHFSLPQMYLAEIYMRRNQVSNAIAEIEEFLRLHPDSDFAPKMRKALNELRTRPSP
jgi:Flp pilus assembly protein TadD